jgi:hypothetical protein
VGERGKATLYGNPLTGSTVDDPIPELESRGLDTDEDGMGDAPRGEIRRSC